MEILIKIKGWESFQSYKDRRPPWVRLHRSLLDNFEFQSMSVNARALLPMIWLLASEDKDPLSGCIRGSYESVAFRLRGNLGEIKAGVLEIFRAGFVTLENGKLEEEKQDVTGTIQSGYETVTPETETETETETEAETETAGAWGEKFFDTDWASYPRKAGNKKKAKACYLKTVTSPASREAFLKKMDSYIPSVSDPMYLKHAETFFRNWEDIEVSAELMVSPVKKNSEIRNTLELIKNIDLGGGDDKRRVQTGNRNNVSDGDFKELGAGNSFGLERTFN